MIPLAAKLSPKFSIELLAVVFINAFDLDDKLEGVAFGTTTETLELAPGDVNTAGRGFVLMERAGDFDLVFADVPVKALV